MRDPSELEHRALQERVLSLADRVRVRLIRRETVHQRMLRTMARRLAGELALPPSSDIFSLSKDNQYWFPRRVSWKVLEDGRVKVFLPLEHDKETRPLYRSLMEHLPAAGLSTLPSTIAQWRKQVSDYLGACYELVSALIDEVAAITGTDISIGYVGEPAVLVEFPLTICIDCVERARSTKVGTGVELLVEKTEGGRFELKCRSHRIAVADSAAEANRLQAEHCDLRAKWAGSKRARDIAGLAAQAGKLQRTMSQELVQFSRSRVVPGRCHLCTPAEG